MKLTVIPAIMALSLIPLTASLAEEKVIANFDDVKGPRWRAVNDGVMGGLSKGEPTIKDGIMTFKGIISLKNNGGFSSARTAKQLMDLSAFDGLEIRIKPDSRKYRLTIESQKTPRFFQLQYWAELKVKPGVWQTLRVPFNKFYPTSFGRRLPLPKLNRKRINAIGFMLYDKKAGAFEINVDSIVAYNGKAPKNPTKSQSSNTIVDVAAKAGSFKTLLAAAKAAGLVELLSGEKAFTVFAPTDAAFAKLPKGLVASLLEPQNKPALIRLLTHHVVPGRVNAATAAKAGEAKSAAGTPLKFRFAAGQLQVNKVSITATDISASNGTIHIVSRVLIPSGLKLAPKTAPQSKSSPIQSFVEDAIEKGTPLFNAGNTEACRSIYETAANALLTLRSKELSPGVRASLKKALVRGKDDSRAHAWRLRKALDKIWNTTQDSQEKSFH